jgi:hypothetical protein
MTARWTRSFGIEGLPLKPAVHSARSFTRLRIFIALPQVVPETLPLTPKTLVVFVDETGIEDYSDPKNRIAWTAECGTVFGRLEVLSGKSRLKVYQL